MQATRRTADSSEPKTTKGGGGGKNTALLTLDSLMHASPRQNTRLQCAQTVFFCKDSTQTKLVLKSMCFKLGYGLAFVVNNILWVKSAILFMGLGVGAHIKP